MIVTVAKGVVAPFLYILYPVTPTASVEAFHERLIWDGDTAVAKRLVGAVGAVASATPTVIVIVAGDDHADAETVVSTA